MRRSGKSVSQKSAKAFQISDTYSQAYRRCAVRLLLQSRAMKALALLLFTLPPPVLADAWIPNFAQVAPGIYRGARPRMNAMLHLRDLGVKTVVSLDNLAGGNA